MFETQEGVSSASPDVCSPSLSRRVVPSGFEVGITILGLIFTIIATVMATMDLVRVIAEDVAAREWGLVALDCLFSIVIALLIYGSFVYQFARFGCLWRERNHRPETLSSLESVFDRPAKPLTVLVPSYMEDPEIVLTTLMSAALQDYPERRVVLLIDDAPNPRKSDDRHLLEAARALPGRVRSALAAPAARFSRELEAFERREIAGELDFSAESRRVSGLYLQAARWFASCRRQWPEESGEGALFRNQVLHPQERVLRARSAELRTGVFGDDAVRVLRRHYRRLASMFSVQVTSFERKRYVNLSHEPNKAMNLNSYIGLLGGAYRELMTPNGWFIERVGEGEGAHFIVPEAEYLITLDADSIILPDYAMRLTSIMESRGRERLAVIQTPYSAIPGARSTLERVAGATTDIQYIIHQGFSAYGATFWVGANALIRAKALADISQQFKERGYPMLRFIQDRTVIEDTESSIDLVERGWTLHNYPERLAYSATPPDFGSLLIQRRRWANGGLIILPKLLRYLARPGFLARIPQAFMRLHYLASIAFVNFGLLLILAIPLTEGVKSVWLPLTAASYFLLYTRDLTRLGYSVADMLRVYALNLVLIPVNLGGVLKSLQQGWTGEKIPFGRTPKVSGRTAAAPLYVGAVWFLILQWYFGAGVSMANGHWEHGAFAALNATMLLYGAIAFIGLRNSGADMLGPFRAKRAAKAAAGSELGESRAMRGVSG